MSFSDPIAPGDEPEPTKVAGGIAAGRTIMACVSANLESLHAAALQKYAEELRGEALILLVQPQSPPDITARNDGAVGSFIASGEWIASLQEHQSLDRERFCYHALAIALEKSEVTVSVIHTAGRRRERDLPGVTINCIIPHRGSLTHLLTAIRSIQRQTLRSKITVCFDQPVAMPVLHGLADTRDIAWYQVRPHPAGPYVIRQHFTLRGDTDYLAFQDSDDLASPDRLAQLVAHAQRHDADVVGSHEIRLNEIDQRVEAVRFPLDVNRALALATGHAQLFPTSVARSAFLKRVGGFSTIRRFGSDYQFLLRAFQHGRFLNCDEFLYVRRRRPGSLTTSRTTSLGSPIRRWLTWRWKRSFAAIRNHGFPPDHGALRIRHARRHFTLLNLRTGTSEPASLQDGGETP